MTVRHITRNSGWMLACSFLLTLAWGGMVRAEDVTTPQSAAAASTASATSDFGSSSIAQTNDVPFPGDEYRPETTEGPPFSPGSRTAAAEERQLELTARYQDPRMTGFLSSTSVSQIGSLYLEAARLIDTRHVSPLSYEERTRRAIDNLIAAFDNQAFLHAADYRSAESARGLQAELQRLKQSPARSAHEAIGLMQWAAELANRRFGMRREAVALEFFNGTLDTLDQYTAFVPARTGFGPSAVLEEQIVGIGVELKPHDDGALIIGVLENSPAAEARLRQGDVITAIDGRSVAGMNLNLIADLIGGRSGTSLSLEIIRDGRRYAATLRRRSVYVSSVSGTRMLADQTGYVRVKQFSESTAEDLEQSLWRLYRDGMQTLILDLRGNPGGLLTEAIDVSNLFVPCGRIVATRGRNASDNTDARASYERTWRIPLVVLIDENSASASEIFAAAVQDNRRGVIVGRRSYGKGTVQTHFPLRAASGDLKLTTAMFYSPDGREMADAGVTPDVHVPHSGEAFAGEISREAEVIAALEVARSGDPARLARAAGACRLER